jgi:hypothetical protein
MPLPVTCQALKIHPAIGIARLSRNDDYFIYGQAPASYKSNSLMKRQAVQFRLFIFGPQNGGIEELTPARLEQLGVDVVWQVRLANRKVAEIRNDQSLVIEAESRSDVNNGELVGQLAGFPGGDRVPLGQILSTGVFIPPKAAIYKANPAAPISGALHDDDASDNTSDGWVSVLLTERATGQPIQVQTFPAWVLVAPADFSPDLDDPAAYGRRTLGEWLIDELGLSNTAPVNPVNQTARDLDRDALQRATSEFSPGIETSIDRFPDLARVFYPASVTSDADEIRVLPRTSPSGSGAVPGELTYGLCSPWQSDFLACTCTWWVAHRPDLAFRDPQGTGQVRWLRKWVDDASGNQGFLSSPDAIVEHVDELGVVRLQNGRAVETERTNDIA